MRITAADFRRRYLAAFPKLIDTALDAVLDDAIDAVYTMFDGVSSLWRGSGADAWSDKTRLCYLHLAAWYITNLYPRLAPGIQSTGGMPIKSKKLGDITINYLDTKLSTTDSVLESLRSNPYGNMALMMIRGAPGRVKLSVILVDRF